MSNINDLEPTYYPKMPQTKMSSKKGRGMSDLISRQDAIDEVINLWADKPFGNPAFVEIKDCIEALPSAEPEQEDYTEMKREFLRMASYIDVILECSDEQKETLLNFISRLSEFMPWTERD